MMKYKKEELLKMYRELSMARSFAIKMEASSKAGFIRTSFHSPFGQEAIGVGIHNAMGEKDWCAPTHRMQTVGMFRFGLYEFIAEIFAKKDGMHKGVSFDFHCSDYSRKMLSMTAILGGSVPQYTGFAWALKQQGKDEVVISCMGEGGCSEGVVAEAWNLAGLFKPPIVYVIENNEWAISVPLSRQTANPNISERAVPYGLPAQIIDGNDILAVRETMEKAIEMARNGQPNVVEMKTLRLAEHFVGDGSAYRHDKEKVADYLENNDCLKRFGQYLLDNKIADKAWMDQVHEENNKELDILIERAKEAPIPQKEDVLRKEYIYANVETGGEM